MADKFIKSEKCIAAHNDAKVAEPSRRRFLDGLLKKSALGAVFVGLGALPALARQLYGTAGEAYAQNRTRAYGTTPKFIALYQDSPNGAQRCGGCVHFIGPNGCDLVQPPVSPRGWCRFFEGRPGRRRSGPGY